MVIGKQILIGLVTRFILGNPLTEKLIDKLATSMRAWIEDSLNVKIPDDVWSIIEGAATVIMRMVKKLLADKGVVRLASSDQSTAGMVLATQATMDVMSEVPEFDDLPDLILCA